MAEMKNSDIKPIIAKAPKIDLCIEPRYLITPDNNKICICETFYTENKLNNNGGIDNNGSES